MGRYFRALIGGLIGLGVVAGGFAYSPSTQAQWVATPLVESNAVGSAIGAVSTDVGMYVKYVGPKQTGTATVAVAAGGDITFSVNGGADTSLGCPTANGVIDVSDTACDTFAETIAVINKSTNWRAAYGAVLGTDSDDDRLITRTTVAASGPDGIALLKDTAVALNLTLDFTPNFGGAEASGRSIKFFMDPVPSTNLAKLNPNPYAGLRTWLPYYEETITSSGTVGNITVYGVTRNHTGVGTAAYSANETVRTIFATLGGATTARKVLDFTHFPLSTVPGERLLVRISSGTDLTAPIIGGFGLIQKQNN